MNVVHLDPQVKPCEDFFQYAIGGWLKATPIPDDQVTWGAFNELFEANRATLKTILENAAKAQAKPGTPLQKVGDFYASGMDLAAIEKAGLTPLKPSLGRLSAIKDLKGLAAEIGRLQVEGTSQSFSFAVGQDDKASDQYIAQFSQGGLGLPDRDYYTLGDARSQAIRAKYVEHVARMFELLGESKLLAKAHASIVMDFETRLAKASRTQVELRDPQANYHKMSPEALAKLAPDFAWASYFKAIGLPEQSAVLVRQPAFFEELGRMAKDVSLNQWKTYLRWHLVRSNAGELPDAFGTEGFAFYGQVLSGAKVRQDRWKRVQVATDGALGELVGQLFVEKAFSPEAKTKMLDLVDNLRAALKERIEKLSWMSDTTKEKALQKLAAFNVKIGYPDAWRHYEKLQVKRGAYLANTVAASRFEFHRNVAKLGKPIDRNEWGMTPQTVNAYYDPSMNEIVFPAGILQPPFFDPKADDAVNYGGIGMVIGHEMTHGFDDQGRQYDAKGNLNDWWTADDAKAYAARTALVVKQANAFEALPGLTLNGELTLGENIADLGGLKIAFEALKKQWAKTGKPGLIDGFTPEQRFFLGYAQAWRFQARPEAARMRVMTDPHSPARFRVNGPLANLPEFFEAFSCGEGAIMRRPADQRPSIW
ncbi:MAG: M13 family metallopeptidase [Firmicutes bacterium]|nr:M13 family metallopeptidase [Bacillota bacterium]